jgi:hypothetical protein
MASAGKDFRTNPATQIKWGLGYIKSTYGDPIKAYNAGMARGHQGVNDGWGWYSKGAWNVEKDQAAHIHQGEMILPASVAQVVRDNVHTTARGGTGGGNVFNFNITMANGSNAELVKTGKYLERVMQNHGVLASIKES